MTTPPDPTSTNWMQSANQVFQPIPIPGSYPQAARTSTPQPQPTGYSSSDSIEYVDDSDGYPVPPSSFSPAPSAPSIDAQAQPTPTSFLNPPPPITQSPLSLHSSQLGPPNAPSIEDPIEPIEYPKNERDHQRTLDPKRFSEAPTSESAHVQDETQKTYTNQAKGFARNDLCGVPFGFGHHFDISSFQSDGTYSYWHGYLFENALSHTPYLFNANEYT